MSVLFGRVEVSKGPTKSKKVPRRKEDDVLVFGYACKLFEDDQKASFFDQEKHLIPWMGDESLLIDRYDARLHFTDVYQFALKPMEPTLSLTPQEQEMERLCDEERYMDLNRDMVDYELQQEEEMKRFQQALAEDGAYNAVSFGYQVSTQEHGSLHHPQNATEYGHPDTALHQTHMGASPAIKNTPVPPTPLFQQPEPFVPPEELEIPSGMEIPDTAKKQAIIERTAVFVCKQGKQMEILVKAKQSGNPQFDFLLMDNWLNPYYKHVLNYVMEGKYCPVIPKEEEEQKEEESEEEDDSDGEYELHPLLQASLHSKIQRRQPSSASSSPLPEALGTKFSRTFAPITNRSSMVVPLEPNGGSNTHFHESEDTLDYSMWYPQGDIYGQYVSSAGYMYHHVAPVLSVADRIPPPPPPPGEGPLEEEWIDSPISVPPLPPPPPPPVPPPIFLPQSAVIPGVLPPQPVPPGVSSVPTAPDQLIPPPPDLQPIVDKLANYVAKNGPDFEGIIKAKQDHRFDFLNPWNTHYGYYELKKQQALEALQEEKALETAGGNDQSASEASKGPISFSIKNKDGKKPKIEYRTSVIYKQSYEQGESDEDGEENVEEEEQEEEKPTSEVNGSKPIEEKIPESFTISQQQVKTEQSTDDLRQQMESIEAAERIAQHLESESRDKQLQLERRRKASLFISMLKKTNPGDDSEPNQSSEGLNLTGKTRAFSETRQTRRSESPGPVPKKARFDNDSPSGGGVGIPSPDSIRVTQDLMAKVLAASKNK